MDKRDAHFIISDCDQGRGSDDRRIYMEIDGGDTDWEIAIGGDTKDDTNKILIVIGGDER